MNVATKPVGTETMTSRDRMLATLRCEEVDRFPVWLKMANPTWRAMQPEPYRSMGGDELLRRCGCDIMSGCGVRVRSETPHVTRTVARDANVCTTTVATPDGALTGVEQRSDENAPWHPTKYMVESKEALALLRWCYRDTTYTVAPEDAENAMARGTELASRDVVTTSGIGPGPLMDLIQHVCGPVSAIYLLADEPELFREVHQLMVEDWLRRLRAQLTCACADTLWMTENTSTTLISPALFEEFCMPYLRAGGALIRDAGVLPVHHMCGKLNALLEMIDELPAAANEAYTTRPLGDVSLAEGRSRMPSKALIGGTNATLWLEDAPTIVEAVADDLAACVDRKGIFLTSAGVLPPLVSFEKAKQVVSELKRL
jgi:uroporphyrinogen-III decarboxylase